MLRRIEIPEESEPALRTLVGLGQQGLDQLNAHLSEPALRSADLLARLRSLKINGAVLADEVLSPVSDVLISFGFLSRNDTPEVVFAGLTESLRSTHRWNDVDLKAWEGLRPAVERLLANETLGVLAKTIDLQYEHTNILTDARVVTDVRPVFDTNATRAIAAIVCHTLRVAYSSDGTTKHLAFALNVEDLRQLRDRCERALRKSEVMTEYLKAPKAIPTRVAGDS